MEMFTAAVESSFTVLMDVRINNCFTLPHLTAYLQYGTINTILLNSCVIKRNFLWREMGALDLLSGLVFLLKS